jgi:hypothetical protein
MYPHAEDGHALADVLRRSKGMSDYLANAGGVIDFHQDRPEPYLLRSNASAISRRTPWRRAASAGLTPLQIVDWIVQEWLQAAEAKRRAI